MKANESGADRAVRVILGIVALVVSYTSLYVMDGAILGIVVAAIGVILILTGFIGFCPAYKLVGLSTSKAESGCCGGGESCGCGKPE